MRYSATLLLVALVAAVVGACERSPVDLDDSDVARALAGATDEPVTLSALVFSAIRSVHAEQGALAALDLVRPLEDIQRRLDGADAGERAGLSERLRSEQLRLVLLVRGDDVVERTIAHVSRQAARLRREIDALHAAGVVAPEDETLMGDVGVLLFRARVATDRQDALDAATRAAVRVEHLRGAVAGAARVPSLDDLFAEASDRPVVAPLIAEAHALSAASVAAVRAGDPARATEATRIARESHIRVVLAALGPDAVADMIGRGLDRAADQQHRLSSAAADRDVSRLQRMNRSAADLLRRAHEELRHGHAGTALDLAGHGVDLLNGLESALTAR